MNHHRIDTLSLVNNFHQVFVVGIGTPEEKIRSLRPILIREEFHELEEAIALKNKVLMLDALCDLQYVVDGTYIAFGIDKKAFVSLGTVVGQDDTIDILTSIFSDRLHILEYCLGSYKNKVIDLLYAAAALTTIQHCLDALIVALGFSDVFADAFCEVHRSNMSKAGPDGKPILREDGKVLKGPSYTPPQLERFCL